MLNRNNTNSLLPPVILFVVFAVFTFMVTLMDVKPVGPYDSGVGLGTLNKSIADTIGVHMIWYHITNILGILALLIAAFFAAVGVLQLVTRKRLARVDKDIILLGGFYIIVLACYVLFSKFAINYRPVMLEGELESSYPSSHTMLAICIMSTAIMQLKWKVKDRQIRQIMSGVLAFLIVLTVVGRLISGVHWFTDIIGGILLSAVLVSLYHWFVMEAGGPGPLKMPAPARVARSGAARSHGARQQGGYPAGSHRSSGARPSTARSGAHTGTYSGTHSSGHSGAYSSGHSGTHLSGHSGARTTGTHSSSHRPSSGYSQRPSGSHPTFPSYPEDPTLTRKSTGGSRSAGRTLDDDAGASRKQSSHRGKSHGRLDR